MRRPSRALGLQRQESMDQALMVGWTRGDVAAAEAWRAAHATEPEDLRAAGHADATALDLQLDAQGAWAFVPALDVSALDLSAAAAAWELLRGDVHRDAK